MKVSDRMTRDVLTVNLDSNAIESYELMKNKNIRRLPVMEKGKLVGIVALSDLNRAAPSAATSLSKSELNYLLAKMLVKDVIPRNQQVITITSDSYIEKAAHLMRKYKISDIPVVDNGQLVGIITETDIFDAFIDILGVKKAHTRVDIYTDDRLGALAEITGLISQQNVNILNTVVYFAEKRGQFKINLRLEGQDCDNAVQALREHGFEVDSVSVVMNTEDV